jgi:pepF/M3 family oligoendopeptidase
MTTEVPPHWDLSNVYPGLESDELAEAVRRLTAGLDEMDGYLQVHGITRGGTVPEEPAVLAAVLAGYIDRINTLLGLSGTLGAYVQSFFSTDSYNTLARRKQSELEMLVVRLERQAVLFRGWIGTVAENAGLFEAALALEGAPRDHAFQLHEAAEQSRYLMSTAEETLAAELSLSGGRAWQKLQSVVITQVKVPFERDGRLEDVPMSVIQTLRTDPDGDLRRRAYEAELEAWKRVREPLAACLNGVKGTVNTLDRRRGRTDCLHQPLDQARIDRQTLEAMLGAMADSLPSFRRYFRHKASLLGKEALPWWDLMAPVGRAERRFTFSEARELLLEQFAAFSPRFHAMAQRAFDNHWIDAEPRDGKQSGAFCMGIPDLEESRVLCNFDGSFDQVSTLAHELGHAYHNNCYIGTTRLQRGTPMTLAETASITAETLVTDAVLAQAAGPQERLAILETFLIGASQVVVDIYSRFLFEREVFERRARAELSADDFCTLMVNAQRAAYGDGLDPRHLHPYMWTWKPHYYRPGLSFYNFPYTFGLLFGLGLYAIYQERGPSFVPEYEDLLRSSGSATAADLAARFSIDIRKKAFWESSLRIIEARIEQYRAL